MNTAPHVPKPEPWPLFKARAKHRWAIPFFYTEWLCARLAYLLSRWSLLAVLEYLGTLSILVAAISYFAEARGRIEQKHYQAWQVINTAQGKGGSGGRIEALQNLNDDHVPLVGIDVTDAFLQNVRLPHADLSRSAAGGADLRGARLAGVNLQYAVCVWTNLRRADLQGANLSSTNLQHADLGDCNLAGADVAGADLADADLRGADLSNFRNWDHIANLQQANIAGVKNAPAGFAAFASAHGAVSIPDGGPSP